MTAVARSLLFTLLFVIGCGGRAVQPPAEDFLSAALTNPKLHASRFWSSGPFLVHFISNANEQNKHLVPVVYVHGLGGSLDNYLELIKRLHPSPKSRPYYAIDLPPFGLSMMLKAPLSIHNYTEMLTDFLANTGAARVNLVCHSMGGQVCIDFALQNPERVGLLTLISPAGVYERNAFVSRASEKFARLNVGDIYQTGARNNVADLTWYDQDFFRRWITNHPVALLALESFRLNFHERIQRLKTKTLIVWGREDKIFSFENGLFLKESIENSALYILDDAGHTPMPTHSDQIARIINKYL